MEVRGQQPAHQRFEETRNEIALAARARVRRARELLAGRSHQQLEARQEAERSSDSKRGNDRIDLSEAANALAEATRSDRGDRAERIAELKAEHEANKLNSPERLENAASRILGE